MARKKKNTPASARRNALADAIRARGDSPYNIWVIRPPFEEEDILLASDIAQELFYYLEGDPRFVEIRYPDLMASAPEQPVSIADRVFARIVTREQKALSVVFSHATASVMPDRQDGSPIPESDDLIVVTVKDLDAYAQRVDNWRRIIPCIRRVRRHPVATLERHALLLLRDGTKKTLRQVMQSLPTCPAALTCGAIAILLRRRDICADVDSQPWSLNTFLWSAA